MCSNMALSMPGVTCAATVLAAAGFTGHAAASVDAPAPIDCLWLVMTGFAGRTAGIAAAAKYMPAGGKRADPSCVLAAVAGAAPRSLDEQRCELATAAVRGACRCYDAQACGRRHARRWIVVGQPAPGAPCLTWRARHCTCALPLPPTAAAGYGPGG